MEANNHHMRSSSTLRVVIGVISAVILCYHLPAGPSLAVENSDYTALPPFTSTEVKPNILFILDNSNSMDEDVDGAAVGSNSPLSRSEIARKAILQIIRDNKNVMRFGLMTYKQSGVSKRYIHNAFYYASYGSSTYEPNATSSPKDPADNAKRYPNPLDPGKYIYYDTALPYYAASSDGYGFCYSKGFTDEEGDGNHSYWCYHSKTSDQVTPRNLDSASLETYGYSDYFATYTFAPTDSDIAAGFNQFGYELSWIPVGDTWFSNSSPGDGILHVNLDDYSAAHMAEIENKLATSQFATESDTPIRNAGLTPIAGTIQSAKDYFSGASCSTASGVTRTNPIDLSCQKNYVILVTDGLPSVDASGNVGSADDLLAAVKTSIQSLRSTSNADFPADSFDIQTYVIGFALPKDLGSKLDDLAVAGGTAVNGKALLANDAIELGQKLKLIFRDISKKISSGAAASVISNSRSGEGVTYQSIFYPEYTDDASPKKNTVTWVGNVNALFIDSYGNLREDTNNNHILDIANDLFVVYKDKGYGTVASRYRDSNANGKLDLDEDLNGNGKLDYDLNEDTNHNGILDVGEDLNRNNLLDANIDEDRNGNGLIDVDEDSNKNGKLDSGEDKNGDHKLYTEDAFVDDASIPEIQYVWDSSSWLNEITNSDIVTQRNPYTSTVDNRYIFTFVDSDNDKVADSGEQIGFTAANSDELKNHLVLFPARSDEPSWITDIRDDGNYSNFLDTYTKRIVNYIRGEDQGRYTSSTSPSYVIDAMRSRQADYDDDGTVETWRLGDIIHSSPLTVNRPFEGYHLLYNDRSYAEFASKYAKRRSVVYVGGNDGMIHAFNAGFYDSTNKKITTQSITRPEPFTDENSNSQWDTGEKYTDRNRNGKYDAGLGSETAYALGSELWAYIPYNLLPHLRWLTSPSYEHVYYNDLSPHAVDMKIFTEEQPACGSTAQDKLNAGCIHPNGWGTVLIAGMRLGGGLYPKAASYDFEVDSMGWTFSDDGVPQTFTNGLWKIEADSGGIGNPHIISPTDMDIDASLIKTVLIRFATTAKDAGSGGARLYWDTSGDVDKEKWNEGSQTISAPSVDVSGKFYTYTFDLSTESKWAGTIKRLRIDPQGAFTSKSSVAIDYIDIGDGKGYVSSYTLLDITNPEAPPTVLAEINTPALGFTTAVPTIIPIKSKTSSTKNDWYMVFGTGPNYNSLPYYDALPEVISNTKSKLFILSLNDLVKNKTIKMLNSSGILMNGSQMFAELDDNSMISDPITVDLDLDYDADVVYFGTVSGSDSLGWQGKVRRILLNNGSSLTTTWTGDSTLFNLPSGQTVTVAGTVGYDNTKKYWVYFGTGRYFVRDDISISGTQNYYGIKEPTDADGNLTWATVDRDFLLDTTDAVIHDDMSITGLGSIRTWNELIDTIDSTKQGWTLDLQLAGERNLGQAALLGKVLTFTTYVPDSNLCSTDGLSYGYGLFYKTGTAYFKSLFGVDVVDSNGNSKIDPGERLVSKMFTVGRGISFSPAIHTGEGSGSTALIQTSSGQIFTIEEDNPGLTKSTKTGWRNLAE